MSTPGISSLWILPRKGQNMNWELGQSSQSHQEFPCLWFEEGDFVIISCTSNPPLLRRLFYRYCDKPLRRRQQAVCKAM